ncbi:MAG: hypothetical protein OD918_02090 [Gammaproteobacteria bacterium]
MCRKSKPRDCDFNMRGENVSPKLRAQNDLVILCTGHAKFEYAMIKQHSVLLLDTRGAFRAK